MDMDGLRQVQADEYSADRRLDPTHINGLHSLFAGRSDCLEQGHQGYSRFAWCVDTSCIPGSHLVRQYRPTVRLFGSPACATARPRGGHHEWGRPPAASAAATGVQSGLVLSAPSHRARGCSGPSGTAVAPKVDPETLVIRASPLRAIRFKRKVVFGITTVGVIALVSVAGIAVKPSVFKVIVNGDDKTDLGARAPADALSVLPKTYGDVPRLGPPLPGDLGRPILERQQQLLAEGSAVPPPLSDVKAQADQAAQVERERQLAELKAARQSALLVQSGRRPDTTAMPMIELITAMLAAYLESDRGFQRRIRQSPATGDANHG